MNDAQAKADTEEKTDEKTDEVLADLPSPPDAELYAGIDVGTNSVKMVIGDLARGRADRIYDQSIVTRIGEGMQANGQRLREAPIRRTLDGLAELTEAAHRHGVRAIAAVGTAALRDAGNRDEFLQRVRERCGLEIEVIPGEEEARLSYLAVRRDPLWRNTGRLAVIDIGGGSTEVIRGAANANTIASRISVNWGAVRLSETFLKADPPVVSQLEQATQTAHDSFQAVPDAPEDLSDAETPLTFVGVGGTLTNLGSMDIGSKDPFSGLHGHVLTGDRLEQHIQRLSSCTIEQRKQIPGLDPRRADIILGGAILLSQALARLDCSQVIISTRGLRWGLLYDRFTNKDEG